MSRIGKQSITIPTGVTVEQNGTSVLVRGPKGELTVTFPHKSIEIVLKNKNTEVAIPEPAIENNPMSAFWGLSRALLANAIRGVFEGFQKRFTIVGVGYRAEMKGNDLILHLGFSHDITVTPPEGISVQVEKNTLIVSGIDKQMVGEVSANIRAFRKPEPYKGKGIRYEDEHVRRKEGKRAATVA